GCPRAQTAVRPCEALLSRQLGVFSVIGLLTKASYRSDCAWAGVTELQATNTATPSKFVAFARDDGSYKRPNLCAIGPRANKTDINTVCSWSKANLPLKEGSTWGSWRPAPAFRKEWGLSQPIKASRTVTARS